MLTTALARYFMEYQLWNKYLSHRKPDFEVFVLGVVNLFLSWWEISKEAFFVPWMSEVRDSL